MIATNTRQMALAAYSLALTACGDSMDVSEAQRYRGEPSRIVCGERWSIDHEAFSCRKSTLTLDRLRPFRELRALSFTDARVRAGLFDRFEHVVDVDLYRTSLEGTTLAEAFPNVRFLSIQDSPIALTELHRLRRLEALSLAHVPAPSATYLAALSGLRVLRVSQLTCPEARCAPTLAREVHARRPDVEVVVDGRVMRW